MSKYAGRKRKLVPRVKKEYNGIPTTEEEDDIKVNEDDLWALATSTITTAADISEKAKRSKANNKTRRINMACRIHLIDEVMKDPRYAEWTLPTTDFSLLRHRCDNTCQMHNIGEYYLCLHSWRIHECTIIACTEKITHRESRTCSITGIMYPLIMRVTDNDKFGEASSLNFTSKGPFGSGGGATGDNDDGTETSSSSSFGPVIYSAEEPNRVQLNDAVKKEMIERAPIITKPTIVGNRLTKFDTVDVHNAIQRNADKNAKARSKTADRKTAKANGTTLTRKTAIRAPKLGSISTQLTLGVSTAHYLLRGHTCCTVPTHGMLIAEHCRDTWRALLATAEWQRMTIPPFRFEHHCYAIIYVMREGYYVEDKPGSGIKLSLIPKSPCVNARIRSRTELSLQRPALPNLTDVISKLRAALLYLSHTQRVILSRDSVRRMGGLPIKMKF